MLAVPRDTSPEIGNLDRNCPPILQDNHPVSLLIDHFILNYQTRRSICKVNCENYSSFCGLRTFTVLTCKILNHS